MPRRPFFQFVSIARHLPGVLNLAPGKSMIETCITPVLLYRYGNYILKEELINQLNSFSGEWAKQCLRSPKNHSNTVAHLALNLESIRSRLLMTKLVFLRRSIIMQGLMQR